MGSARPVRFATSVTLIAFVAILAAQFSPVTAANPNLGMISLTPSGQATNGYSYNSKMSADGTRIVYQSDATDLAPNDTNGTAYDVFLYDEATDTTSMISRPTPTTSGDGDSRKPDISADGNWIVYASAADDLVANDTNGKTRDIFLYDVQNGVTTLISRPTDTTSANGNSFSPSISGDGMRIVYHSRATDLAPNDTNGSDDDIFLYDVASGTTTLISRPTADTTGNGRSEDARISEDGLWVVYESAADDLVPDDTNSSRDVFLYDVVNETTTLLSRPTPTTSGNASSRHPDISGDGSMVVFYSFASDLTTDDGNGKADIFLHDVASGTTTLVSRPSPTTSGNGDSTHAAISSDGNWIVYESAATDLAADDSNGELRDIFRHDVQGNTTTMVSRPGPSASGNWHSYNAHVSPDGQRVLFESEAWDLVTPDDNGLGTDVFVWDADGYTGPAPVATTPVGNDAIVLVNRTGAGEAAIGYSDRPEVSDDGRWVVFDSWAGNLVDNDTNGGTGDVFLHDATSGDTILLSRPTPTTSGDDRSWQPHISADGNWVVYRSRAGDLVADDTNGNTQDVFLYDRQAGTTALISRPTPFSSGNGDSGDSDISADGSRIVYESRASNLVLGDSNGDSWDVFLHDVAEGTTTLVSRPSPATSGDGDSIDPDISADGNWIVFRSTAPDLVPDDDNGSKQDIFLYEIATETMTRVTEVASGMHRDPALDADGSKVTFTSTSADLAPDDTNGTVEDVFLYDVTTGETRLVSRPTPTTSANDASRNPGISDDGERIVYHSAATDLAANDTNGGIVDVFLFDTADNTTTLLSRSTPTTSGNSWSGNVAISGDVRWATFTSNAWDLVSDDVNGLGSDIFLLDLEADVGGQPTEPPTEEPTEGGTEGGGEGTPDTGPFLDMGLAAALAVLAIILLVLGRRRGPGLGHLRH